LQVDSLEASPCKESLLQVGSLEVGLREHGQAEVGAAEVSGRQIGALAVLAISLKPALMDCQYVRQTTLRRQTQCSSLYRPLGRRCRGFRHRTLLGVFPGLVHYNASRDFRGLTERARG
jgi:hypothetical protein